MTTLYVGMTALNFTGGCFLLAAGHAVFAIGMFVLSYYWGRHV